MNQFFIPSVMAILILYFFASCSTNKSSKTDYDEEAIALNDEATAIQMKVIGNEWPMDSLAGAVKLYQESIALDSTYGMAYHNLYNCLIVLDKYEDAEKVCTEWIDRNPDDYTFRLRRANLQLIQGKLHVADMEYALISEYLDNLPPLKLSNSMDEAEIEQVIIKAHNIFIVKNDSSAALSSLRQLHELHPENPRIKTSIEAISTTTRAEYLRQSH